MREFFPSIDIENGSRLIYSAKHVYEVPPELYRSCMQNLLHNLQLHTIDGCMQIWLQQLNKELQQTVEISEQLV
jgi:hypothetical protein